MKYGTWTEKDWQDVLHQLKRGRCILMLGPDASAEELDGEWEPLTEQFSNKLHRELAPEIQREISPNNLAQTAQYYQLKDRRSAYIEAERFYESKQRIRNDLYADLAALPFSLIITSTPDKLFYNALNDAGKNPNLAYYNFNGKLQTELLQGTVNEPLVYYLYGILDDLESLVLTENDLIAFLVSVIEKDPAIPSSILSELRSTKKSLLFLGFGFQHWYLRILLYALQQEKETKGFFSSSFALEQYALDARTVLYFDQRKRPVKLCQKRLRDFVKTLRTRYEGDRQPSLPSQFTSSPVICICYDNDSKEQARELAQHLKLLGCTLWRNLIKHREALKRQISDVAPGHPKGKKIRRQFEIVEKKLSLYSSDEAYFDDASQQEIDYLIIVQSPGMLRRYNRKGSHDRRLIQNAIKRQKAEKPGLHALFLLKAQKHGPEFPKLLEVNLPMIDMSDGKGIEKLTLEIRRDHQRRRR